LKSKSIEYKIIGILEPFKRTQSILRKLLLNFSLQLSITKFDTKNYFPYWIED